MARRSLTRNQYPLYPEHPEEEHSWRLRRARQFAQDDGLDVLLLARNVNVFYMTGSRFVFLGRDCPTGLVPQSTSIITESADIYCQRFGPYDTDDVLIHTTWSDQFELYDDEAELVNILKDLGLEKGTRIGTEWGDGLCVGINPRKFLRIKQRIEKEIGAEIVDATPTIRKMMAVKSPLEIERLKTAVRAASRALQRTIDRVRLGMSELEIAHMASQYMLEEGGEFVTHSQVMATPDDGPGVRSCDALDRKLEVGWVGLDVGCKFKRYGSDINRGFFVGRDPQPEEVKLHECRRGVNDLMDTLIAPGVSMDSVLEEVKKYVEDSGCVMPSELGMVSAGHGLGLETYQPPNLVPSRFQPELQDAEGTVTFQQGMVFTFEAPVGLPDGRSFINVEDDVVVTESGVQSLNPSLSRDVVVKK